MSNKTKVLYAAYVTAVLFFAGTARGEDFRSVAFAKAQMQTSVQISQVSVDPEALELLIAGVLPNPCFGEPNAQLVLDTDSPNTLLLRLSSPIPTSMCVTRVSYYKTIVSLPALAQAAQLALQNKATYLVKIEGYPFEMTVNGSDLLN